MSIGSIAWWIGISGAIMALKQAGAARKELVLLGIGGLMAFHVPIGPPALVCLSVAAYLIERRRETAPRPAASPGAGVMNARDLWRGLRSETGVFRVALSLIAVHVLDDNFVQPPAGTSAADHLVSGSVSLAALALAAWAHGRVRGGRRGAIALLAGVSGIVAGVEAVHYTSQVGASGDDYSGLLAIPAGLTLLGLGAATLWRTRRAGGSRARRYLRRSLLAAAGAIVTLFAVAPLSGAYLFAHLGRPVVPEANIGGNYERVTFTTSDGLELAGWYVPSKNGAAVIAFPGRNGPQAQTRMLARHGYGVLLFDRRGQGESEGDPHAFGWEGEKDIKAAIAFLKHRPDVDPERIGGIGLSVGGEMMLHAAAETDDLKAVVSEGAGARSVGEFREMPDAEPLQHAVETMITAGNSLFANSPPPPLMQDIIHRIAPRPVFIIWAPHGVDTEALNPEYFKAAGRRRRSGRSPSRSTSAACRRGRRSTSGAWWASSTTRSTARLRG